MYPIQVGDIVLVTCNYITQNVTRMINTFHFRLTGPTDIADGAEALNDLAGHIANPLVVGRWANVWSSLSSSEVELTEVWAQKIWPARFIKSVFISATAGVRTGAGMPGLVQWTIVRRGTEAGKGRTGALRVPGLAEADVEFGQLTVGFLTETQAILPAVKNVINLTNPTAQWQPVIFHRLSPPGSQVVTGADIAANVRSQRSRINFRGI